MRETMSIEEYKALPTLKGAEPRETAEAVRDVLYDKKGKGIKILHVEDKTIIAEYFVLCTGNSSTQVKGLADEVEYKMSLRGLRAQGVEGRGNGSWILLDYGSVIVHVFSREAREFYNLDKLYGEDGVTGDEADEAVGESGEDGEDGEFEEFAEGGLEDFDAAGLADLAALDGVGDGESDGELDGASDIESDASDVN